MPLSWASILIDPYVHISGGRCSGLESHRQELDGSATHSLAKQICDTHGGSRPFVVGLFSFENGPLCLSKLRCLFDHDLARKKGSFDPIAYTANMKESKGRDASTK